MHHDPNADSDLAGLGFVDVGGMPVAVPEPAAGAVLVMGSLGLLAVRRQRFCLRANRS